MSWHLKKKRTWILLLFIAFIVGTIAYHSFKTLPKGLSFEGNVHQVEELSFLYDLTYKSNKGGTKTEQ